MTVVAGSGRLVVALPAEEAAIDLMAMAAGLAARLERECVGLLVESEALSAAAGLPFVRAVSTRGMGGVVFDAAASRRALEALAERARQRLLAEPAGAQLRWSLQVVRGGLQALALGAGDVLALGPIDPLGPSAGGEPTTLPCPVLLVAGGPGPLLVLHTGAPGSLELGRRLASAEQRELCVVAVSDGGPAGQAESTARVLERAPGMDQAQVVTLAALEPLLARLAPGLVVLDSNDSGTLWRRVLVALGRRGRAAVVAREPVPAAAERTAGPRQG